MTSTTAGFNERSALGRWAVQGLIGGIVAGVIFAMFEMIVAAVMMGGDAFFMPLRMIGGIALGQQALSPETSLVVAGGAGLVVHMMLSAVFGVGVAIVAWAVPWLRRSLRVRHTLARVNGRLTLLEPKTERSRRAVILPDVVVASLRAHRTRQRMERLVAGMRWVDTGHVFTTTVGTPIEAAAVTRAFHAALARAGLPRSRFHDLRHAAATFLLAQGFTLEDVKSVLGHSSIVVTSNTYGHVVQGRLREIARGIDAVLNV